MAKFRLFRREQILQEANEYNWQSLSTILGNSEIMQKIYNELPNLANNTDDILLFSSKGNRLKLLARILHNISPYKKGAFIILHCANLSSSLLEKALFGDKNKYGIIKLVKGGTLYLNNLDALSLSSLEHLLLSRHSDEQNRSAFRLIASIEYNSLQKENISLPNQLIIPSLRERPYDIPYLIRGFCNSYEQLYNRKLEGIHIDRLCSLKNYLEQNNIEELEAMIENMILRQS